MATDEARTEVLTQLERAYERHSVAEQLARVTDPELAEDFHKFAVMVLNARLAEDDDPKPRELAMHCLNCAAGYAAGGR